MNQRTANEILLATAFLADVTLRAAPQIASVLDLHIDLNHLEDPRVPADRQLQFQTDAVTRLFVSGVLSTREQFAFAHAIALIGQDRRLYDQTWAHVVRAVAPYCLAAAPAVGRA